MNSGDPVNKSNAECNINSNMQNMHNLSMTEEPEVQEEPVKPIVSQDEGTQNMQDLKQVSQLVMEKILKNPKLLEKILDEDKGDKGLSVKQPYSSSQSQN